MRDIKFRVWSKEEEKMYIVIGLGWYKKDDEIKMNVQKDDGFYLLAKNNNFELMQYTGLKDKNGKEIYEGDILKIHYVPASEIPRDYIKRVDWDYFLFDQIENNQAFISEIIGNIWEHPEILKETL